MCATQKLNGFRSAMTSVPVPPATSAELDLELGSAFLLFSSTVLFGFVPFWVVSGWGSYSDTRHRVQSLVRCAAAGALLASCLLDVIPKYLARMRETFNGLGVTLCFPVPEFILAMGFLLLLLTDQVLLTLVEQQDNSAQELHPGTNSKSNSAQGQAALLVGCGLRSHDHLCAQCSSQCSRLVQAWPEPSRGRSFREWAVASPLAAVHAFVLVLALTLGSVLDGVAVGQRPDLLLRSSLVALSLAVELAQSQLRRVALAACMLLFSASAPLGVVLGGALRHTHQVPQYQLTHSTLQGLAAGSIAYIIFMEVLPHALNTRGQKIPKLTLLLTGFSTITAVLFVKL